MFSFLTFQSCFSVSFLLICVVMSSILVSVVIAIADFKGWGSRCLTGLFICDLISCVILQANVHCICFRGAQRNDTVSKQTTGCANKLGVFNSQPPSSGKKKKKKRRREDRNRKKPTLFLELGTYSVTLTMSRPPNRSEELHPLTTFDSPREISKHGNGAGDSPWQRQGPPPYHNGQMCE